MHPEEFTGAYIPSSLNLKGPWKGKSKYEYNSIAIDLCGIDINGSLKVSTIMDKDSCKRIPQVDIVDGYLIVAINREF